jgi:nitroreductase/FMN reductase [NAD(P)H]
MAANTMPEPDLRAALTERFGTCPDVPEALSRHPALMRLAERGSCRAFETEAVPVATLETLCATALSAPTKSDLQQRDFLLVTDSRLTDDLRTLLGAQAWIAGAPSLVVVLANNRRQRQLHALHGQPFANDHLDALFNASVDAGIALAFLVAAAEAIGLGCCPISTIRNHLPAVRDLLGLPDHVFPVAGLALGHPLPGARRISPRLPLAKTLHHNRFRDIDDDEIASYDARRLVGQPASSSLGIGWSKVKADQYAEPQRTDFSAFMQSIGFRLG